MLKLLEMTDAKKIKELRKSAILDFSIQQINVPCKAVVNVSWLKPKLTSANFIKL